MNSLRDVIFNYLNTGRHADIVNIAHSQVMLLYNSLPVNCESRNSLIGFANDIKDCYYNPVIDKNYDNVILSDAHFKTEVYKFLTCCICNLNENTIKCVFTGFIDVYSSFVLLYCLLYKLEDDYKNNDILCSAVGSLYDYLDSGRFELSGCVYNMCSDLMEFLFYTPSVCNSELLWSVLYDYLKSIYESEMR